jgi:hypothetical protein
MRYQAPQRFLTEDNEQSAVIKPLSVLNIATLTSTDHSASIETENLKLVVGERLRFRARLAHTLDERCACGLGLRNLGVSD